MSSNVEYRIETYRCRASQMGHWAAQCAPQRFLTCILFLFDLDYPNLLELKAFSRHAFTPERSSQAIGYWSLVDSAHGPHRPPSCKGFGVARTLILGLNTRYSSSYFEPKGALFSSRLSTGTVVLRFGGEFSTSDVVDTLFPVIDSTTRFDHLSLNTFHRAQRLKPDLYPDSNSVSSNGYASTENGIARCRWWNPYANSFIGIRRCADTAYGEQLNSPPNDDRSGRWREICGCEWFAAPAELWRKNRQQCISEWYLGNVYIAGQRCAYGRACFEQPTWDIG